MRYSQFAQRGITLIELMVVLVIIAIIASIAYPSYTQFVVRTKRSSAKSALMQIADRQQQYFMDSKRYAASLTDLGFGANPFVIGDDGQSVAGGSDDRVYSMSLSNVTATTFTATATPQLLQASKDTKCGNMTLAHTGEKGQSGAGDNCW